MPWCVNQVNVLATPIKFHAGGFHGDAAAAFHGKGVGVSGSGIHIIYYNSDVTPGPVELDTVRDALTETALTAKQTEAYNAQLEAWRSEMNIKKYPKVLG